MAIVKHTLPDLDKELDRAAAKDDVEVWAVSNGPGVVLLTSCLVLLCLVSWQGYGRLKAQALLDRLLVAKTKDVPTIVRDMPRFRRWVDPLLKDAYTQAQDKDDSAKQLHVSLALLPVDSDQVEYLYEQLLKAQPEELLLIRGSLLFHKADLTERLLTLLENPKNDQDMRFRAACALAEFAPDNARWEKVNGNVAETLVIQRPFMIAQWTDALKGAGRWLMPPLADFLVDEKRSVPERGLIANVYGTYAAGTRDAYARLENQLVEASKLGTTVEAKVMFAKKQASIGVALMVMGQGEKVWPLLKHQRDPTMRSFLIERLGPGGVDPKLLIAELKEKTEVSAKRAILLSLGEFGLDRLPSAERRNLLPRLLQMYQEDVDPGIHGAVEWLLRQWQAVDEIKEIDKKLATGKVEGKRQWYVNGQGQTMMLVPKPGEFWMGEGEERHRRRIDRSFAVASKHVMVDQFLRFRKQQFVKDYAPTDDCPMNAVSWYDAAEYCNWLSKQQGIAEDQWCYLPNKDGKYADGMTMAPDFLSRTGYRLPTEGEWEYACRAGGDTGFSFGEADDPLSKYAWFLTNSLSKSHPVGTLKPNDLGLFDMHGNVWSWCQDAYVRRSKASGEKAIEDAENMDTLNDKTSRVLRGGSFVIQASALRSSFRNSNAPTVRYGNIGFRVVRTLPP